VGSVTEEGDDRYVQLMGADLGPAFEVLSNDLILIHANWEVYTQLFSDHERMDLLMQAAGGLFALLRHALLFDVVLLLAKLVDKPDTGGKPNLTLQCLPELVSAACDDLGFQSKVEAMVQESCTACQFAVQWRHKRIAHRDRGVALGTAEMPLPQFEPSDIDDALSKAASVLNTVESFFSCGAHTAYSLLSLGQPDSLFYFLKRGMEAENADAGL